jgi:hypothetical protein
MTLVEYLKGWDNEYLQENVVVDAINKIKDIFKSKYKRLKALAYGSKEWEKVVDYYRKKETIWQNMFEIIRQKLVEKIDNEELTLSEAQRELFRINREIHTEVEEEWANAETAWQQMDDDAFEISKKFYEKLIKVTAKKIEDEFGIKLNVKKLIKY